MPTSLGPAEILVILIVALIVLGPKKLPEAGRQVGKTIAEIRKWSQGFQDEIRSVIDPDVAAPSYPPLEDRRPGVDTASNGHAPESGSPIDPPPSEPPGPPPGEPPHL